MTAQLHFHFSFHALEKEMATHSSVPAWRIPGMGEPDGLPSMGSHRVGHNWSDLAAAVAVATHWLSNCNLLALGHAGFSLWHKGSLVASRAAERAASVVTACKLTYSEACGIFPHQESNPCPLYWQADSYPLHCQGSPRFICFYSMFYYIVFYTY